MPDLIISRLHPAKPTTSASFIHGKPWNDRRRLLGLADRPQRVVEVAMTSIRQWPHTWLGFWREDPEELDDCPSVFDWVDPEWKGGVDLDRVVRYLETSPGPLATSAGRCVICRARERRSLVYKTDGVWFWRDDLPHYLVRHDVRLPEEFHARILRAGHVPPKEKDLWRDERGYVDLMKRLSAPASDMESLRELTKNR